MSGQASDEYWFAVRCGVVEQHGWIGIKPVPPGHLQKYLEDPESAVIPPEPLRLRCRHCAWETIASSSELKIVQKQALQR